MEMRTASRNDFLVNTAKRGGGAVYIQDNAGVSVLNNLFVGNKADSEDSPPIPAYGGALWVQDSTANIINNTFAENMAVTYGGAVYVARVSGYLQTIVNLVNDLFWENTANDITGRSVYVYNSPTCSLGYCNAKNAARSDPDGNSDYFYYSQGVSVDASSCLYKVPLFVDGSYRLRFDPTNSLVSPCIDKGLNPDQTSFELLLKVDRDGSHRPIDIQHMLAPNAGDNAFADIGAYEVQQ